MNNRLPALTNSAPSLQIKTESDFDRLLQIVFGRYHAGQSMPKEFLKSIYFSVRPQSIKLFTEDPQRFRSRIDEPTAGVDIRLAMLHDYKTLVNSVNQQLLSRYPFEVVAQAEIDFRDNDSVWLAKSYKKLGSMLWRCQTPNRNLLICRQCWRHIRKFLRANS